MWGGCANPFRIGKTMGLVQSRPYTTGLVQSRPYTTGLDGSHSTGGPYTTGLGGSHSTGGLYTMVDMIRWGC